MVNNKHDQVFLEILKEERSIVSFLDSVFGFLYRCTDFYHNQNDESQKVGFPVGIAQEVVQKMFHRYERQTRYEEQAAKLGNLASSDSSVPTVYQEVVVGNDAIPAKSEKEANIVPQPQMKDSSEIYNGDDRGVYRWSQSIRDIDVIIPVSKLIQKAKQLKVKIDPHHLKVEAFHENEHSLLVDQNFTHKVTPDECVWSLVQGEHIQINLEKKEERWWDRLFLSDPPINTSKIDTTMMASDLGQEEHMKIAELMANQERRQQFTADL